MVFYVKTWGFPIASKQAHDHQNRSSYEKIVHILLSVCWLFSAGTEVPGSPEVPGKFRGKFRVNQRVCTYLVQREPGSSGPPGSSGGQKFRADSGPSSGLTRKFAHMCPIAGPEVPGLPRSSGLRFSVHNRQIWLGHYIRYPSSPLR